MAVTSFGSNFVDTDPFGFNVKPFCSQKQRLLIIYLFPLLESCPYQSERHYGILTGSKSKTSVKQGNLPHAC